MVEVRRKLESDYCHKRCGLLVIVNQNVPRPGPQNLIDFTTKGTAWATEGKTKDEDEEEIAEGEEVIKIMDEKGEGMKLEKIGRPLNGNVYSGSATLHCYSRHVERCKCCK